MRLKRLTLHGFKTFADKTDIQFSDGVTVIVGPNGSGKSNVIDAISWCLGEQKASSLRATKAQDVIFAGSSRRKPMGMAEVSLTVDNEDHFLPLDFSEVTVTRRIYRSGDAEYLLNKVPCRLKDITDLFLDTGVGRGAYAIVNQSEIDAILSARPEDRRELFEEAAGIKKYRVRKREAQRKLENTEQNLVRIRDIVREVESQLDPLARQADVARRYHELTERLRAIEVGLLAADYQRYRDELAELLKTAEAADRESANARTEATSLEETAIKLGRQINDAEGEMDSARLMQQTALAEGERIAGRIALSEERRTGAQRAAETLERDLTLLATEKQTQETEAAALEQIIVDQEKAFHEKEQAVTETDIALTQTERALSELSREVAGQEADFVELARRLAAQQTEWKALKARLTTLEQERAETQERMERRFAEAEATRTQATALQQAITAAQAEVAQIQERLTDILEPARKQAQEVALAATEQRTSEERRLAEQGARLAALEETEAAQEGYFAGVRSVTRAVQSGRLRGRFQVVADAISVPAHLDTAIETALGASVQDIITDREADAKAAIAFLNETRGGRATFLPLDALRDSEIPESFGEVKRQFSGVLGPASELVGYAADVAVAVRVLLARILIVDDLDTATRSAKRMRRDWARIVTLNGEVVVPTGAITGGTQGRASANLLGRKREITELTATVARTKVRIQQLRDGEREAQQFAEAARQTVRDAEAEVARARESVREAERQHQNRRTEAERLQREADALRQRMVQQEQTLAIDRTREAALAVALRDSETGDETAQATREELHRRRAALTLRQEEIVRTVRAFSTERAALAERLRTLRRDRERAREAALRATIQAEERRKQAAEAQAIIAAEEAQRATRDIERERARKALAEATARFEKWRDRRQALLNENFQLTERIKSANRNAARATETTQAARVKAARVETQRDTIGQRLLDEYDLHPESALALTGGDPVDKSTAQEIGRLRRDIKALGNVNTGAVEEYERLSERSRFLREQQQDLEEARTRLLTAISEIDQSTRGVFMETFQAVEAAFFRLFVRLFGGGATELVLTNPEDIFETGIEILAQPPGKKRQNLSLLSGGERALTATALLFAFLEVRPAPFCVLDEVDAPLDGANVEKFADLLRDFGKSGQFIVVTHNATTMEAAPLWFGITMQEPGVSRALSLDIGNKERNDTIESGDGRT